MTCYTSEKKVKSVAFASFVLLLTKHRSNKQDGYLDMSNPGALFLDYSYSRCAIPVLVKFQDGSKPLEASSITEAGFWLEENVGIVKGGAWSMGVRNVLMGRRTEYRGVTAEYLDPERKCKGVCSRCERYLNLRESEHWDGDICAVCWKAVTPKVVKPPVIRDKPSHTREIRAIEDNGKELILSPRFLLPSITAYPGMRFKSSVEVSPVNLDKVLYFNGSTQNQHYQIELRIEFCVLMMVEPGILRLLALAIWVWAIRTYQTP